MIQLVQSENVSIWWFNYVLSDNKSRTVDDRKKKNLHDLTIQFKQQKSGGNYMVER